jgi:hypothetical protein
MLSRALLVTLLFLVAACKTDHPEGSAQYEDVLQCAFCTECPAACGPESAVSPYFGFACP